MIDSPVKKKEVRVFDPKVATRRSAILPGWGQAYNRKYWKIPIVYGALGTCAGIFIFNLNWYKRTRFAYGYVVTGDPVAYPPDQIHEDLQFLVDRNDAQTLGYLRDSYRRDLDYSAIFFLIFWGLNVVDASVDAHLKSFDVSPDLSFRFKPGYSEMARTNGLSFVVDIGRRKPALLRSQF